MLALHYAVAKLARIMPPSPLPVEPVSLWREIEDTVGSRLPTDYREFVDRYGDGTIDGVFSVFYPISRHSRTASGWSIGLGLNEFGAHRGGGPDELPDDRLITWGGDKNGNRCCWLVDSDDPDMWPVYVFFRHRGVDAWQRFDGGMAEFLLSLVTATFESSAELLMGGPWSVPRWHALGDEETDYGDPPSMDFDDGAGTEHPPGRHHRPTGSGCYRLPHATSIWLRAYNAAGGDQEYYFLTGRRRQLIELGNNHHEIRLDGGIQSPGMVYIVSGYVEIAVIDDPHAIAVELVREGEPSDYFTVLPESAQTFERDGVRWARLDIRAEIPVAAEDRTTIELRVLRDPVDGIVIGAVSLAIRSCAGY